MSARRRSGGWMTLVLALAAPAWAQVPVTTPPAAASSATAIAGPDIPLEPGCRVAQASLAGHGLPRPGGASEAALVFWRNEPTRRSAVCSSKGWQGARVTGGVATQLDISFLPASAADLEVATVGGQGGSVLVWSGAEVRSTAPCSRRPGSASGSSR